MALRFRGAHRHAGGQTPVPRRVFHAAAGSTVPIAGIFMSESVMVVGLAVLLVSGVALEIARFKVDWLNRWLVRWFAPLLKADEDRRVTGATYMVAAGLIAFLLFDVAVAVAALLFLSLGDPAAALVGRRMPGLRLFGKSPVGTVAFFMVSLGIVAVLVGSGAFPYHWGFLAGAAVAALVELASLPPDDNLTIPIAAGAAMHLLGV
jgi:dolichol kinase